ncbi:MAG: VWA domain-containing protein [Chloroflexi bacterium]|nr:VWA domain-containing protein [Chloroflexota bacterium]
MPYSADISRTNPGCFLFLIDQSGSMTQALGGQPGMRKMDQAADSLNRTLNAISQRCSQGMDVRDYFHIGALGYKTDQQGGSIIQSLLAGTSVDQPFLLISQVVDIAEIEEREVRESDGAGGLVNVTRNFPVWLRPDAEYGTPMCEALDLAGVALRDWISQHPNAFPPIVINISDGMATDGDPENFAAEIMSLGTSDGNTLMFNAHLSDIAAMPVQFPAQPEGLADEHAMKLFRMSSTFPPSFRDLAATLDVVAEENARGFVFNANLEALVRFLEIGTRGVTSADLH